MSKIKQFSMLVYFIVCSMQGILGNYISASLMLVCLEIMLLRWAIEDKKDE